MLKRIVEVLFSHDPCMKRPKAEQTSLGMDDFRALDLTKADFEKISGYIEEQDWDEIYGRKGAEEFPTELRRILTKQQPSTVQRRNQERKEAVS